MTPIESDAVGALSVHKLYIRFFDVEWNNPEGKVKPIAQIQFSTPPPTGVQVVPVVFITNNAILQSSPTEIDTLSMRIARLVAEISKSNKLSLFPEIQIDCDWTASSREKYFRLLEALKKQPLLTGKSLSATIRLHQVKYRTRTGVPPVDKGLLMCYNMGNLHRPEIRNSILDVNELKKYAGYMGDYPLQLDVALPIFDWYVWFRNDISHGLVRSGDLSGASKFEKTRFEKDTVINGYQFRAGDWLRYEGSDINEIKKAATIINKKISSKKINVVLYHLDESNLERYTRHDLQTIFDCFH